MKRNILKITVLLITLVLICSLTSVMSFTVMADAPEIEGDASRLTVSKSSYAEGEAIMVSAIGSGTDWIGIYRVGAGHSIRWTYVDTAKGGPGSGKEVNLRTVPNVNGGEPVDLPAGTYIIRLMANDSSDFANCIAMATITIGNGMADTDVSTPLSATYELENDTDGFATGTVTVKMPADKTANRSIVMYWADGNGKLAGYTSLAKFKVTGETTTFTFGKNVIIPAGATRLLVYSMNNTTGLLSPDCVTVELPEGAAHAPFSDPVADLFIMSDIHITTSQSNTHNKNFAKMLKDVQTLNKDGLGIFVAGDMADTGKEQEYLNMMELYGAAGKVPPLFLSIGNHDLSGLPFDQANAMFLKYATLPDGSHPTDTSYDFWLGGYHFIFLGTDHASGLHSSFDRATMDWLDEKISENRDPARPVFLFLHQSLSNTVSGSLPGEGWSGVDNEGMLRKVLKDYPEVMFFNGHSHWTMDSVGNMFEGDSKLPCRIFNCASVAYLWSGYNVVSGEHLNGSQGYMVRLYEDRVYVLGRDFARGEWIPAAQYCIIMKETVEETMPEETTVEEPVDTPTMTNPEDSVIPSESDTENTECENQTSKETTAQSGGCGSVLSLSFLIALVPFPILMLKKKEY